jgi:hypothetical protein
LGSVPGFVVPFDLADAMVDVNGKCGGGSEEESEK